MSGTCILAIWHLKGHTYWLCDIWGSHYFLGMSWSNSNAIYVRVSQKGKYIIFLKTFSSAVFSKNLKIIYIFHFNTHFYLCYTQVHLSYPLYPYWATIWWVSDDLFKEILGWLESIKYMLFFFKNTLILDETLWVEIEVNKNLSLNVLLYEENGSRYVGKWGRKLVFWSWSTVWISPWSLLSRRG